MTAATILAALLLLVLVRMEAVRVSSDTVRPGLLELSENRHPAGRRWLAGRIAGALVAVSAAVFLFPVLWELLT